ncbi:MAG: hypothetical protein AAB378_00605 [Patescibacteria group bacterium]
MPKFVANDNKNIGIVGLGMVGMQVQRWFKLKNHKIFTYDKFKASDFREDVDRARIIFLCLPTPYSNKEKSGVDLSVFKEMIRFFKQPKLFVVKSTVPVGTTEKLQTLFPRHYFMHNPELLTETTAWQDFSKPALQLIGCTQKSRPLVSHVLKILPSAKYAKIMSATAAEIFKYSRNAFFATKVIFANQIYDLCQAYNVDYKIIQEALAAEPWIGSNHLHVIHKKYRGFGGKCLPKDLKTLIKVFQYKKIKPELFKAVDKINSELLKKQKLEKTLNKFWLRNINIAR